MSQEFPTASLDNTFTCQHFCLVKAATCVQTEVKFFFIYIYKCYATPSVLIGLGLAKLMMLRVNSIKIQRLGERVLHLIH